MLRALIKAEEYAKRYPSEAQQIVAGFSGMDLNTPGNVGTQYLQCESRSITAAGA